MPVVAIAGGTSLGLGRAITTALLQGSSNWTPLILSRTTSRPLWLQAVDPAKAIPVCAVDYSSPDTIAPVLREYSVHTLISVTLVIDGSQAQVQKNLLHAARQAGVKRFAPSSWSLGMKGHDNVEWLRSAKDGVWEECEAAQKEAGMICTRFNGGIFMNYYGIGAHDHLAEKGMSDQEKLEAMRRGGGYIAGDDAACQGVDRAGDMPDQSGSWLLSIPGACAEVPVDEEGRYPRISATTIRDYGRFTAAALDMESWESEMSFVGDTMRMDELIRVAEELTGKKIAVTEITPAELEKQIKACKMPEDFLKLLWLELKKECAKDEAGNGVLEASLNELLPEVDATTFGEYLAAHWTKK